MPKVPTLLLFNMAPEKRARIQVTALRAGCRLRAVPPERFGCTLSQLLSGQEGAQAPEEPFGEELLVMAGLDEHRMDFVLTALRRERTPVALKAVVTPTNASWTARELYAELCREREAFAAGRQAHQK